MTTVKGYNGTVSFDGQFVTISREGRLARMTMGRGDKRIPVRQLTAIQLKPAGALTNGFIQFTVGGGIERNATWGNRTTGAANDENSVIFLKKQQAEFEAIRAEIEAVMAGAGPVVAATPDLADEIAKLAQLRDQGVLTTDEFETKKADLLSRI